MSGYNYDQQQSFQNHANQHPPIQGSTSGPSDHARVKVEPIEIDPYKKLPEVNEANRHFSNLDRRPSNPNYPGPPTSYNASLRPSGHGEEHAYGAQNVQAYQGVPYGYNTPYTQSGPATQQVFIPPQMPQYPFYSGTQQPHLGVWREGPQEQPIPRPPESQSQIASPSPLPTQASLQSTLNYRSHVSDKGAQQLKEYKPGDIPPGRWKCCLCESEGRDPKINAKSWAICTMKWLPEGSVLYKTCDHEWCPGCSKA